MLVVLKSVALGCLLVSVGTVAATAQWLNYPTPGVPRLANGKTDFAAKTPRTVDGKPDLSGVWASAQRHHDLATDARAPLTPWAQQILNERRRTEGRDIPTARCLPSGIPPDMLRPPLPFKIVQTPRVTVVLLEEFNNWRQIFTDGRPLPANPELAWLGYSVGKWDGDTFAVETAGFNDQTWVDGAGTPHSEALHLMERFTRPDFGHLEIAYTFDDPKAFTQSWSSTVEFNLQADTELFENQCENEKDAAHLVGR